MINNFLTIQKGLVCHHLVYFFRNPCLEFHKGIKPLLRHLSLDPLPQSCCRCPLLSAIYKCAEMIKCRYFNKTIEFFKRSTVVLAITMAACETAVNDTCSLGLYASFASPGSKSNPPKKRTIIRVPVVA